MHSFKAGDRVMVKDYESWGEGIITKIIYYDNDDNDKYTIYFKRVDFALPAVFRHQIYQTSEQVISYYLSPPPINPPTEPIIFATSKVDNETLKTFSEMKGEIEFEINRPNSQFKTVTDFLRFLCDNTKFELKKSKNGISTLTIQGGSNTYRSSGRGFTADYTFIDEIDLDDFFKEYNDKGDNFTMPNITNYKYTEDTAVTTIEWSDGTKTTVRAEYPETADPYTGFVTACAKKAFGNNNTINKLFDEWVIKKPKREMNTKIKANAALLEEKRIAEKRKAKREKWTIRKRAAEINREYEARKLAHEKYGTPMENKITENREDSGYWRTF